MHLLIIRVVKCLLKNYRERSPLNCSVTIKKNHGIL